MTRLKKLSLLCSIFFYMLLIVKYSETCRESDGYKTYTLNSRFKICSFHNALVSVEDRQPTQTYYNELHIIDKISSIIPNAFKNVSIIDLRLHIPNQNLTVSQGSFNGLKMLKSLTINSGIITLGPRIFAGLESLRSLNLSIDGTRQNFENSLAELVSLENLTIINSYMMIINSQTFNKIHLEIKRLDLSKNNIMTIGQGAFSNLNSLTTLIINKNNLAALQEGIFEGLNLLKRLEIASNKLTRIGRKMFRGLDKLETLDLSDNLIMHIGDKSFSGFNMSILSLSNNKLTTIGENDFEDMSVKILDLSNNTIGIVGYHAFKNSKIMTLIINKNLVIVKNTWGFRKSTKIIQV